MSAESTARVQKNHSLAKLPKAFGALQGIVYRAALPVTSVTFRKPANPAISLASRAVPFRVDALPPGIRPKSSARETGLNIVLPVDKIPVLRQIPPGSHLSHRSTQL